MNKAHLILSSVFLICAVNVIHSVAFPPVWPPGILAIGLLGCALLTVMIVQAKTNLEYRSVSILALGLLWALLLSWAFGSFPGFLFGSCIVGVAAGYGVRERLSTN
jgi:hypothetical protein